MKNAESYSFKDEYIKLLKLIPSFDHLTMVPIHTEITHGNTIQRPDRSIMVIDWDEVRTGPAVLDLGVGLINHLVTDTHTIREAEARAYFQAYFAIMSMSEEDKEYIFWAAIYWALLWIQWFKDEQIPRLNKVKWALENKNKITGLYK